MKLSWRTTISPDGSVRDREKIKILLVSLDCTVEMSRSPMLGPAFLVAHSRRDPLIKSRVEFDIRQFSIEEPVEVIIGEIITKNYHAIGFSCYVWNYCIYEQIIPVLKQIRPETILIMGGQQLLGQERKTLRQMPALDIIVYRDGEIAFTEIVRQIVMGKYDWSAIGGIFFQNSGEIIDTSAKKKWIKYADIASPYLEGVITGRNHNLFMMTYRGCPGRCAFCVWSETEGHKIERLPLDRIRQELSIIQDMGATNLGIFDSNFNHPPSRAEKIFDMILENKQLNLVGTHLFAQSMNDELASKMGRVQTLVGVGLQSTNPETNTKMGRRFDVEKMAAGIWLMKNYNLQFTLQMIVGLPGDTYDTIARTLNYALQFRPPVIDAFRLMVLPGTEYRLRAEEYKLIYEPRPNHHVISHYSMSCDEINRAERMAQALTIFYNRPQTREEMFIQAAENNESIIDFCDSIGKFIDNFNLLNRQELRKGNLIKMNEEAYLLEILEDFNRFRKELSEKSAR